MHYFFSDNHDNFTGGYREYIYELFESNVMFLEGKTCTCTMCNNYCVTVEC